MTGTGAVHPETVCPFRIAINGEELACPIRGSHTVHRYRTRDGVRHEIEFIVRPHGVVIERTVYTALVPQLDLVAMRHGYTLTSEPWDEHPDEWTHVTLTPAEAHA